MVGHLLVECVDEEGFECVLLVALEAKHVRQADNMLVATGKFREGLSLHELHAGKGRSQDKKYATSSCFTLKLGCINTQTTTLV